MRNGGLDPALGDIAMRCLCRAPADRYQAAKCLLADLEAWEPLQTESVQGDDAAGLVLTVA